MGCCQTTGGRHAGNNKTRRNEKLCKREMLMQTTARSGIANEKNDDVDPCHDDCRVARTWFLPLGRLASSTAASPLTSPPPFPLLDLLRFVSGCCCCSCEADRLLADDRVDRVVGGEVSSCKAAAMAAAVAGSGSVPKFAVLLLLLSLLLVMMQIDLVGSSCSCLLALVSSPFDPKSTE